MGGSSDQVFWDRVCDLTSQWKLKLLFYLPRRCSEFDCVWKEVRWGGFMEGKWGGFGTHPRSTLCLIVFEKWIVFHAVKIYNVRKEDAIRLILILFLMYKLTRGYSFIFICTKLYFLYVLHCSCFVCTLSLMEV